MDSAAVKTGLVTGVNIRLADTVSIKGQFTDNMSDGPQAWLEAAMLRVLYQVLHFPLFTAT